MYCSSATVCVAAEGGGRVVLRARRRWCVDFSGRWGDLSNLTELVFDMDMGVLVMERRI